MTTATSSPISLQSATSTSVVQMMRFPKKRKRRRLLTGFLICGLISSALFVDASDTDKATYRNILLDNQKVSSSSTTRIENLRTRTQYHFTRRDEFITMQYYQQRQKHVPKATTEGEASEIITEISNPNINNDSKHNTRRLGSKSSKSSSSSSSASSGDSVTIGIARAGGNSSKSSKASSGSSASNGSKSSKSSKSSRSSSNIFDGNDSESEEGGGGPSQPSVPPGPSPTRTPTPPPTVSQPTPNSPDGIRDPPTLPPNDNLPPPTLAPVATPAPTEPAGGGDGGQGGQIQPRCQFGDDGLFGTQLGLSEVSTFAYQAVVIQSVTPGELNLDILSKVENAMGERILERVIDQCAIPTSEQRRSPVYTTTNNNGNGQKVLNPFGSDNNNKGRRKLKPSLRSLQQSGMIEGFSIRPRDFVVEGVDCVNTEPVFPCFVIQGRVTSYTEGTFDDTTKEKVGAAIRDSIQAGGLDSVDNRILEIIWRDLDANPIPDQFGSGDGGDTSPTPPPDDTPTSSPAVGGNGGPAVPVVRAEGGGGGLETWMIALIAVGGAFSCIMAFLCLRKPKHNPLYDEGDDSKSGGDDASSSSSSSSSAANHDDAGVGNDANADRTFGAPTPLYRPPGTDDNGNNSNEKPAEQEPLNSAAAEATAQPASLNQNPYIFNNNNATEANTVASTMLSPVQETSFNDEEPSASESQSKFEQESSSEETSYHEEEEDYVDYDDDEDIDNDEEEQYGDFVGATSIGQGAEEPSSVNDDIEFNNQPNKFEEDFDGNNNAFPTAAPPSAGGSTSEEFSSEYSSYEDEEVEEEYEIEYVEDSVEELEGLEEEEGEESWEDEEEDDGQDILPWS